MCLHHSKNNKWAASERTDARIHTARAGVLTKSPRAIIPGKVRACARVADIAHLPPFPEIYRTRVYICVCKRARIFILLTERLLLIKSHSAAP